MGSATYWVVRDPRRRVLDRVCVKITWGSYPNVVDGKHPKTIPWQLKFFIKDFGFVGSESFVPTLDFGLFWQAETLMSSFVPKPVLVPPRPTCSAHDTGLHQGHLFWCGRRQVPRLLPRMLSMWSQVVGGGSRWIGANNCSNKRFKECF